MISGSRARGSLYGGSEGDLANMSDVSSQDGGANTPVRNDAAANDGRPKRRSVGDAVPRRHEHARAVQQLRGPRGGGPEDESVRRRPPKPGWTAATRSRGTRCSRRRRRRKKFAAIETLFNASGIDLSTIPDAGPKTFDAEPGVTCVRLRNGRNMVLFAPSLGHAVAALPEASAEKTRGALVRDRVPASARQGGAGSPRRRGPRSWTGQHLAGALSQETSRVAVDAPMRGRGAAALFLLAQRPRRRRPPRAGAAPQRARVLAVDDELVAARAGGRV